MAKKESQKSLDCWTKEEWGTKSGKNSTQGKNATGERYLPKKARESLSDKEYCPVDCKKRASIRKGQKHSKQPDDVAKKQPHDVKIVILSAALVLMFNSVKKALGYRDVFTT